MSFKKTDHYDVVIIGAGLAGLYTALHLKPLKVLVVAAAALEQGASSTWAQGGIAAALSQWDSPVSHAQDTMVAGCFLNDPKIVDILTNEAQDAVHYLLNLGVPFDRNAAGEFILGKEAAHSHNRIAKIKGDRAGREIMHCLVGQVNQEEHIDFLYPYTAFELLKDENGAVCGVFLRKLGSNNHILLKAKAVVLATGGSGHLYQKTTNPHQIRGEGLGLAVRAGAVCKDMEFIQFHPTALDVGLDPMPLATEALRGEGAVLMNEHGDRFMLSEHELAELAPRDCVARGIWKQIQAGHKVFLDATECVGQNFKEQFPTVWNYCIQAGFDPSVEKMPVAPAQHYQMGGLAVDEWGQTSLQNLWAVGEVACTGSHGANRLASNSLLEAIVFGKRVAHNVKNTDFSDALCVDVQPKTPLDRLTGKTLLPELRHIMTENAGVLRCEQGLKKGLDSVDHLLQKSNGTAPFINYAVVAKEILTAALIRKDSIGGHFRVD